MKKTFRIFGAVEESRLDRRKALLAIGIFVGALLLGVFKVVSLPIAVLLGAFGVFISKLITPEGAYREVDWRAVILIACMLSLGAASAASSPTKRPCQRQCCSCSNHGSKAGCW
ncbi:MAG: hypothetical protein L0Z50_04115 [Verrucomicrobiales bacterium]|nr:hypothetical protein [Verrucomicrobiales bacterium]